MGEQIIRGGSGEMLVSPEVIGSYYDGGVFYIVFLDAGQKYSGRIKSVKFNTLSQKFQINIEECRKSVGYGEPVWTEGDITSIEFPINSVHSPTGKFPDGTMELISNYEGDELEVKGAVSMHFFPKNYKFNPALMLDRSIPDSLKK